MPTTTIGNLIRRLRDERGLTQGQLAEYARVPRSWLSVIELGRVKEPDRDRLEQVAVVLRVSKETLFAAAGYRTHPGQLDIAPETGLAEALGWAILNSLQRLSPQHRLSLIEVLKPERGPDVAAAQSPEQESSEPFQPTPRDLDTRDLVRAWQKLPEDQQERLEEAARELRRLRKRPEGMEEEAAREERPQG